MTSVLQAEGTDTCFLWAGCLREKVVSREHGGVEGLIEKANYDLRRAN